MLSDLALWATRLATMVFTVGYILPIFDNPYNSYYKVRPENKCKFRNLIDTEMRYWNGQLIKGNI